MRSRFMRDGCLNDSLCSSFFDYVKRFGHFWRIYSDLFISSKLRVRGLFYSLQRKMHEFKTSWCSHIVGGIVGVSEWFMATIDGSF